MTNTRRVSSCITLLGDKPVHRELGLRARFRWDIPLNIDRPIEVSVVKRLLCEVIDFGSLFCINKSKQIATIKKPLLSPILVTYGKKCHSPTK